MSVKYKTLDADHQHFLETSGLAPASAELKFLAERIVAQIQETESVYRPKRATGRNYPSSLGWNERLKNYEWPPGVGFVEASRRVTAITNRFRELSFKLENGKGLSSREARELQDAAFAVFKWGGVTRGASKQNPSVEVISSVVRSALKWHREKAAPMDSGWTKVAAFSTDWVEELGGTPQAIYDSRVANSLIRNVEKLYSQEGVEWLRTLQPILHRHLRRIQGRGGTRKNEPYTMNWKSGFGSGTGLWRAQYFASFLVRMMRDVLNEDRNRYDPMPTQDDSSRNWTTRGVEMVLFMDGY
jgi:hypothetical protein